MTSVLLLMDLQNGVIDKLTTDDAYVNLAVTVQEHAEDGGIPVILVDHDFTAPRPTAPPAGTGPRMTLSGEAAELNSRLLRGRGEIVVTKNRTSAFSGGALKIVLDGLGATHLALAGLATSGVVLSTVRHAADLDYDITVLHDLCLDFDDEVHRVLTTKVFARQATVLSAAEWMQTA